MFPIATYTLAEEALMACRKAGLRLMTVESCTGGMVGAALTEVPGYSDIFLGGLITYDNAVKHRLAQVPEHLILRHGAVSEEVARAMAEGGRTAFGAGLGVSLTGIAGPSGGSLEKPVGLVYVATATGRGTECQRCLLHGDRTEIRLQATEIALRMVSHAAR